MNNIQDRLFSYLKHKDLIMYSINSSSLMLFLFIFKAAIYGVIIYTIFLLYKLLRTVERIAAVLERMADKNRHTDTDSKPDRQF